MIFRSLTRRREIGANSYLLEVGKHRLILDAGAHPKEKGLDALPNYEALQNNSIDAVVVTHAHHDHIGALPVLLRRQMRSSVYMTEATGEVGAAMLHNSVNVMTKQREELGVMEYPLFTHRELDELKPRWIYRDVNRPFKIQNTDIQCTFYDAGHIMGSAGVLLKSESGQSLFYTGDVNFESQTISKAADFPTEGIDYLVVETTRGEYARPADFTRKAEKERLAQVIRETMAQGGSVLIPVFALGKTQELLMMLDELYQMELIPQVPVVIGGLSTKMTVIYDHYANHVPRHYEGFRILEDMEMLVAPRRRRKEIQQNPYTIYALSSGMMSESTASNQFAYRFIDNPRNTVAFVGYTDEETPGFLVRNGKPGDKIKLDPHLPPVELRARVESFDFSAHAVREDILEYILKVNAKKTLLVHGDEGAQQWFVEAIKAAGSQTEVILPEPGVNIRL